MPLTLVLTVAAGVVSAAAYLSLLSGALGTFVLAYFAQLPLFAVGLMLGVAPAAVAASAAVAVALAAGGVMFGLLFALVNAMPALLLVRQALLNRGDGKGGVEWYPPGQLIGWMCGLACALFGAALLFGAWHEGGLEGYIREALAAFLESMGRDLAGQDAAVAASESLLAAAATMSRFLPGAVAASWIAMTAINGAAAQAVAIRAGRARRPTPEMAQIDLPSWVIGLTAIAGVGALMPGTAGFVGINLIMILGVGFVFAGLAVVHALTRSLRLRRWWLIALYLMTFMMPWLALFIGLMGILEPWAKLRVRWAATPRNP